MNEKSKPLGVLLVSAARHQGAFAEVFSRHPSARLVAVSDDTDCEPWVREANRQLAETWNIPYIVDLAEALNHPEVDIASICSFYRRHGPQTVQALRAGKHVLLDKQPLAMTVDAGRELAQIARQAEKRGIKLTYMHHSLDAAVHKAFQVIERGDIGQPIAIYAQTIANYGPGEDPDIAPTSRYGRSFHPMWWDGGELIHHGAYVISCARHLMCSDITSVYANAGAHFNMLHRETGIDDLTSISLGFENGGIGTLVVGRAPNPASIAKLDHFVHIVGTGGIVTADWEEPTFLLMEANAGRAQRRRFGHRADHLVIDQFLRAIVDTATPVHGVDDGLAELEAHLAAIESVTLGRPVAVPMSM